MNYQLEKFEEVDVDIFNQDIDQMDNYQDIKEGQDDGKPLQNIHFIKDDLALRVLASQKQNELQNLANAFNITYFINLEQGYIEIYSQQEQKNNKKFIMKGGYEDDSRQQMEYFIEYVNDLIQQIKNQLEEKSFDSNYDEYMRIKKVISKNDEYSKLFLANAQLDLVNVDSSYNISSSNSCLPQILKKYIIQDSISIKICKLDKPEQLNIHFFDFFLLNMSQEGLFIDSFGMDLYQANQELKSKIKKIKQDLAFHDSLLIEEMEFNDPSQKKVNNLTDVFRINSIKEIQQTPITLCIQTAKDEQSCIYNLKTLIERINFNKINNNHRGYFQFGLSLHSSCSENYLDNIQQILISESKKQNYFKQPTEFWIIISDGHEKKILNAMDKLTNQKENFKKCKYVGYYSQLNKNKIKRFSQQNQYIINKSIQKGMQSAQIIFSEQELTFDIAANPIKNQDKLANENELIEKVTCDLNNMSLGTSISNVNSPIFEDNGHLSYFDESTFQQYSIDKSLTKLVQDYKNLGINSFSYEIDFYSKDLQSIICELNFSNDQIRIVGGKGFLNPKQNLTINATTEEPQQGQVVEEIEEEEDNNDNGDKKKPKLIIRGDKLCIDILNEIKVDIEQKKYLLQEISSFVDIPKEVQQIFSLLELQHKVWIHVGPHSIQIQGYRKTVGRLIPQIYKYLNQIEPKEEKKEISIKLAQNLSLPSTWTQQEGNLLLVTLDMSSSEAQQCVVQFRKTLQNQITQIQRIQNIALMKNYLFEKQKLLEKGNATEMLLFHGTRAADPKLIYSSEEEGFDFRLSNDGSYGKGTYFHEMSSYSHGYKHPAPDGDSYMFLATVLVGVPYASAPNRFTAPPFKNGQNGVRYDSVMSNGAQGQNMYIVYHNSKSYPLYLIKYR